VNRWQHVMYHTYTVDVHSIFLVEEVRRLWKGDFEKELPGITQLVRDEDDLLPLILGCLLHDIGKGFGGDHSPKGAVLAQQCLERLGADPELTADVVFLVSEHLVMSHIAQRRDLSDPRLVLEFARTVGSRSRLRCSICSRWSTSARRRRRRGPSGRAACSRSCSRRRASCSRPARTTRSARWSCSSARGDAAQARTEELRERASRRRRSRSTST
jgi:hypothetical protein